MNEQDQTIENPRRQLTDKKKIVYKCDYCHKYFDEGFRYKTNWTEVGANEPTEYCTLLCEKCFYKWEK